MVPPLLRLIHKSDASVILSPNIFRRKESKSRW